MKKKDKKAALLQRLAASLGNFYPELDAHFACPTCLKIISINSRKEISDAHIVPRSAGGNLMTVICTSCNSDFGSHQDKWLGEYIHLRSSKSSILHTRHQLGHFFVAGERVGGKFQVTPDGTFEFLIMTNSTSPKALESIHKKAALKQIDSLTIPVPLLANRQLISYGLITSAYLLWFRELGYSWAFQEHLDPIRQLIRNPTTTELPTNCNVVCPGHFFDNPWIGIGFIGDQLVLLCGIADRIVFLPPADRRDFYSLLPTDFNGLTLRDYRVVTYYDQHNFDGPLGVVYHDRVIITPDVMFKDQTKARYLLYPPNGGKPEMLYPISAEEFERKKNLSHVVRIKTQSGVLVPQNETGRPS